MMLQINNNERIEQLWLRNGLICHAFTHNRLEYLKYCNFAHPAIKGNHYSSLQKFNAVML